MIDSTAAAFCRLIQVSLGVEFSRIRRARIAGGMREEKSMDEIQRRAFMKGAAIGTLAFTVDGAEVMLTPRQARAQGAALRTLTADQAATLDAMGETLVPGAKDAGITYFVDQQISIPPQEALLEARIMNVKPPFPNFYRAALGAIDGASSARYGGRNFAQLAGNEQHEFVDLMRQNKLTAGKAPPPALCISCCAATRWTWITAPWMVTRISAFLISRTSRRPGAGDMANSNDKVDVVIVGAGASGSLFAAVLAKAGKKVVLLESGPDWQLDDLISSDIWGRRIKPAGPPFLFEGKNPYGYVYQAGWGTGGAALHYFANFPGSCPTTSWSKALTAKA